MRAKDRCGAKGIIRDQGGVIGVEILSLITEVAVGGDRTVSLPADLSVGMFIPMHQIFKDHRGLVLLDQQDGYLDEGEIWPVERPPSSSSPSSLLEFVPDYDETLFGHTPAEKLVGQRVGLKHELYDQLGAYRRLKEFKKA